MKIEAKVIKDENERGDYTFNVKVTRTKFNWRKFWFEKVPVDHTMMGRGGTFYWRVDGTCATHEIAFACVAALRVYRNES